MGLKIFYVLAVPVTNSYQNGFSWTVEFHYNRTRHFSNQARATTEQTTAQDEPIIDSQNIGLYINK